MGDTAASGRWAVGLLSRPTLANAGLAALIAGSSLLLVMVGPHGTDGRAPTVGDWMAAGGIFALILLRRRLPLVVLAVATLGAIVAAVTDPQHVGFDVATVIAAYTVASRTGRRVGWLAGGTAALVTYLAGVFWAGDGWLDRNLAFATWIGMATAFGYALRVRRAYVAEVEERARRAEQTREEEARRQVAEERIRIARDLHDVVAHHISVISVHAGLAGHTLRSHPDRAAESLDHVQRGAQAVLDELATILAVLRQNGDGPAPTEPVRGLSRLGELLDSLAAVGLRVSHHQVGQARTLPPAVDQAAYRIVQEALTNAHKHGAATTAQLRVEYTPDAIAITVSNPAPAGDTAAEAGHGMTGMRERALTIGGTFTAGPMAPGQFHVTAVLPTAGQAERVP